MKDKDLLKLLKKDGWQLNRIQGSHHVMEKAGMIEVVPLGNCETIIRKRGKLT